MLYQQGADPRRDELLGPCGAICNYEAEMEAIRIAIEAIGTADIVFTDALSILQAIDGMGEWPW